jgi:hypothetical protein
MGKVKTQNAQWSEWALSIDRLIELTARDQKRVVRPVSPQLVIRPVLLPKKRRR